MIGKMRFSVSNFLSRIRVDKSNHHEIILIPYTGLDVGGWTDKEHTGESARTFGEKCREYLKVSSPIYEHQSSSEHGTSVKDFSIVSREGHNFTRIIKESIYIRVTNPTLNRNIGKYDLPHI